MKLRALLFVFGLLFVAAPAPLFAQTSAQSTSESSTQTSIQASTKRPTCQVNARPGSINKGGSVTVSWQSANASTISITGVGASLGPYGSVNLIPTRSTRYIGTFVGPGGKATCEAVVTVMENGSALPVVDAVLDPGMLGPAPNQQDAPVLPTATSKAPTPSTPSKGIVPCTGLDCEMCHLAELAQRIINFLIGISIPLAALMFAWAGAIYFSSSIETSYNKVEKAHKIFTSVLIGFLIVIAAWLGVQTVLKIILDPAYYASWNEIKCVGEENRLKTGTVSELLKTLGPFSTQLQPEVTPMSETERVLGNQIMCDTNTGYYWDPDKGSCYNPDAAPSEQYRDPVTSVSQYLAAKGGGGVSQWVSGLNNSCMESSLNDCLLAQAVLKRESNGDPWAVSKAGAIGLMQVLPTTACSMNQSIDGCGGCRTMADNTNGNCSRVAQAIQPPTVNMGLGTQYLEQLSRQFKGDPVKVAAAYNWGPGRVKTWNGNLGSLPKETQKYVPDVMSTYQSLK